MNRVDNNYDILSQSSHDTCINILYETNTIISVTIKPVECDLDTIMVEDSVKMSNYSSESETDTSNNTVNLAASDSDRFSETYSIWESDTTSKNMIDQLPNSSIEIEPSDLNTIDIDDDTKSSSHCTSIVSENSTSELSNIELDTASGCLESDNDNSDSVTDDMRTSSQCTGSRCYTLQTGENTHIAQRTTEESLSNPNSVYIVLNSSEQLHSYSKFE